MVEPDGLTRWSISQYLGRWFIVEAAPDATGAESILARRSFSAIAASDLIPESHLRRIQSLAERRNPSVRMVRMVTGAHEPQSTELPCLALEKPFELAALARLLGVPDARLSAS